MLRTVHTLPHKIPRWPSMEPALTAHVGSASHSPFLGLFFYFILEYSRLTTLWWFQMDSKRTQSYVVMDPFSHLFWVLLPWLQKNYLLKLLYETTEFMSRAQWPGHRKFSLNGSLGYSPHLPVRTQKGSGRLLKAVRVFTVSDCSHSMIHSWIS